MSRVSNDTAVLVDLFQNVGNDTEAMRALLDALATALTDQALATEAAAVANAIDSILNA